MQSPQSPRVDRIVDWWGMHREPYSWMMLVFESLEATQTAVQVLNGATFLQIDRPILARPLREWLASLSISGCSIPIH